MRAPFHADLAVVGAGIVGLAHALAAARRGLRVVLFERTAPAVGASVRNFGLVWPVGQPADARHHRALRSREIWSEVATATGLHFDPAGSLHLAYRTDEWAVVAAVAASATDRKRNVGWRICMTGPKSRTDFFPSTR